jgi:hypothetical protein
MSQIQELSVAEIEEVNGARLSAAQYLGYTALGAGAVALGAATGGVGLVFAGTFLVAMADVLK